MLAAPNHPPKSQVPTCPSTLRQSLPSPRKRRQCGRCETTAVGSSADHPAYELGSPVPIKECPLTLMREVSREGPTHARTTPVGCSASRRGKGKLHLRPKLPFAQGPASLPGY